MKVFIIVSESCNECPEDKAISILGHLPDPREVKANELSIGGMWCIHNTFFEGEVDGKIVKMDYNIPDYWSDE